MTVRAGCGSPVMTFLCRRTCSRLPPEISFSSLYRTHDKIPTARPSGWSVDLTLRPQYRSYVMAFRIRVLCIIPRHIDSLLHSSHIKNMVTIVSTHGSYQNWNLPSELKMNYHVSTTFNKMQV